MLSCLGGLHLLHESWTCVLSPVWLVLPSQISLLFMVTLLKIVFKCLPASPPRSVVLDCHHVSVIDYTVVNELRDLLRQFKLRGALLILSRLQVLPSTLGTFSTQSVFNITVHCVELHFLLSGQVMVRWPHLFFFLPTWIIYFVYCRFQNSMIFLFRGRFQVLE